MRVKIIEIIKIKEKLGKYSEVKQYIYLVWLTLLIN